MTGSPWEGLTHRGDGELLSPTNTKHHPTDGLVSSGSTGLHQQPHRLDWLRTCGSPTLPAPSWLLPH